MTDREKLIELLETHCDYAGHVDCKEDCTKCLADHLIANGVTVAGELPRIQDGVTVTMTREQAETIHDWLQYGVDYHKCKKVELEYCKDKKMRQELIAQHETALTKTFDALKVIAAALGITVF